MTPIEQRLWEAYEARIRVDGRQKSLGVYATAHEAGAAYLRAKRLFHEGCTI